MDCAAAPDDTVEQESRHLSFSTEDAPDDLRAQAFRNHMLGMFAVGLQVNATPDRPLVVRMHGYRGRNLRMASLRFSPHSTVSLPISPSSDTRMLVSLHKRGQAVVAQGGRESRIEPGSVFVIDPARPFHIETSEIETDSIYVNANLLRQRVPELDLLTARAIPTDEGAASLFRDAVQGAFRLLPGLDEDVADDVAEALLHLLAPALRAQLRGHERMPARLKAHHHQRIVRFVRAHLSDSALDVATIAQGVGLSPRHLYQIFEETGKPLMKWVWSERLERCRRELAIRSLRQRSISEIAFAWGFSNMSHFSRSFKAEFGRSPSDYRRHPGPGADPTPASPA